MKIFDKITAFIKKVERKLNEYILQDKQLHGLWSFVGVVAIRRAGVPRVVAFGAVLVAGILKEVADGKWNTMRQHVIDVVAVAVGAAAGALLT